MINLVLADDHELILDGISNLIKEEKDIKIVETCNNGIQVLETLPKYKVDVLLLDLDMPEMNGLECAIEVKKRYI